MAEEQCVSGWQTGITKNMISKGARNQDNCRRRKKAADKSQHSMKKRKELQMSI